MPHHVSQQIRAVQTAFTPFVHFFTESTWARRQHEPNICDFVFGNPHEMPLAVFTDALQRWAEPQNKDWFAYKMSEPAPRAIVAATLREQHGLPFEPDDVFLTTGAFAAIAVALAAIVNPDDEVIFLSPPWFFYEGMITAHGAKPVRVKVDPDTFDLDVEAIAAAITQRTRAIIINTPNNPTGKIYPPSTLERLGQVLTAVNAQRDYPIYLLSDEAYCRILYDGQRHVSPTTFYPYSFLIYTYGKTLLAPGQRIGYIALPPTMPNREPLRDALFAAQVVTGYTFPNALLQHALPDLESLSIDLAQLQRKRDRLVAELRDMGYDVHLPEGTFYLLPRSPIADDLLFSEILATHNIFCLPGTIVEVPGYFRLSLTANDEMIERALPGFAAAREHAARTHEQQLPA